MTGEEMERAIAFLLEGQSKLENQLTETNRQVAGTNRQLQVYAETQTQFIKVVSRTLQGLAGAHARTDRKVEALADMGAQTETRLAAIAQAQARADELRAQSDARLDRLAALIERHLSDGHGG